MEAGWWSSLGQERPGHGIHYSNRVSVISAGYRYRELNECRRIEWLCEWMNEGVRSSGYDAQMNPDRFTALEESQGRMNSQMNRPRRPSHWTIVSMPRPRDGDGDRNRNGDPITASCAMAGWLAGELCSIGDFLYRFCVMRRGALRKDPDVPKPLIIIIEARPLAFGRNASEKQDN
ncbi:hypothetical protein AXG93_3242s1350 [Marchantia polymorpha subsp. ruderalis]|uniref:Uncharacterized protein n=1 Tax=Marchantia polymorpha subsp. ruderalis TaxID=1480154 RepID=A0A176WIP0_MARPO|nr:hypothetical protein AXG93_3242s1350 [Marchantia polymorpha subsp. ruderalis]